MNDRELLELAAKAAEYDARWMPEYDSDNTPCGGDFCLNGNDWNPPEDDGDALRLAVKLRIFQDHIGVFAYLYNEFVTSGLTELSATRLAIVRTAAEIGRTIP